MTELWRRLGLRPQDRVLDVGGLPFNWSLLPQSPRLVMLNIAIPTAPGPGPGPAAAWVIGDGRRLPFRDGAFDLVFSNAVIEHVGDFESQRRFAEECRRVGLGYYVQTPNRRFPVEVHLMRPFIHWMPRPVQERLLPRRKSWFLSEIRLLNRGEMERLFEDAEIWHERVLGLSKSLIAVRRPRRAEGQATGQARRSSPSTG
jgi:methyltransferase family protein